MGISRRHIVDEFVKLVSIDSPSYGERSMADYLKERLSSLGLSVTEDGAGAALGSGCGNLLAVLDGDPGMQPLLFCTHMDTVAPALGKRAVVGEDGVIQSGGDTVLGADDFAGITAVLEALRAIREEGLSHRPLELLFTVAEETYNMGASQFDYSGLRSKEAYVLDLTGPVGSAANQAPTILSFTVNIRGRAAHAGFAPETGIHAVRAAADAVCALPMGRVEGGCTLNVGIIQGGAATNIVPELCTVRGEVRSFSHDKALELAERVKKQFEASAERYGASCGFELKTGCRAYLTPPGHPVVGRFEKACRALGLPFSLEPTFGGSDNNVLAQKGISGIVLANAMNRCHSPEEYTTVDELERISRLTLYLMTTEPDG